MHDDFTSDDPVELDAPVALNDSVSLPPSNESVEPPVDDVFDYDGAKQSEVDVASIYGSPVGEAWVGQDDEVQVWEWPAANMPDEPVGEAVPVSDQFADGPTMPNLGNSHGPQLVTITRPDGEELVLDKVHTSTSQREQLAAAFLDADTSGTIVVEDDDL